LREFTTALGARQTFIKPYCPWQNGRVECYNRTLQVDWAYVITNDARCAALAPWPERYNNQRRA
jgi:transposase InsO family protein